MSKMTRQEFIEHKYIFNRYMEHLSDEELNIRLFYILNNIRTLTPEGKIGVSNFKDSLREKIIEIFYEFKLRQTDFIKDLDLIELIDAIPHFKNPRIYKITKEIDRIKNTTNKSFFFKFGQVKYLQPAFESGYFRIIAATEYADPSLNSAQYDDELVCKFNPNPANVKIILKNGTKIQPLNIEESISAKSNYYVYCLSNQYLPRLISDFHADACLVIKDPKRFIDAMSTGFDVAAQGVSKLCECSNVKYYDPLLKEKDMDVFNYKHFKYSYQKEFRIYWITGTPPDFHLNPVFLSLGSLKDYAELLLVD